MLGVVFNIQTNLDFLSNHFWLSFLSHLKDIDILNLGGFKGSEFQKISTRPIWLSKLSHNTIKTAGNFLKKKKQAKYGFSRHFLESFDRNIALVYIY